MGVAAEHHSEASWELFPSEGSRLPFVKIATSVKHSKARRDKAMCAYVCLYESVPCRLQL